MLTVNIKICIDNSLFDSNEAAPMLVSEYKKCIPHSLESNIYYHNMYFTAEVPAYYVVTGTPTNSSVKSPECYVNLICDAETIDDLPLSASGRIIAM